MANKDLRAEIFRIIHKNWPVNASGICRHLGIDDSVSNISKVIYHLRKLNGAGEVHLKKVDRALVAWPNEIEKLRIIHEMIR